jgi:hypothetical protein
VTLRSCLRCLLVVLILLALLVQKDLANLLSLHHQVTQVTLRSENKAEGEIWVEKLKQTAMWFNDRTRKAAGLRAGAGA